MNIKEEIQEIMADMHEAKDYLEALMSANAKILEANPRWMQPQISSSTYILFAAEEAAKVTAAIVLSEEKDESKTDPKLMDNLIKAYCTQFNKSYTDCAKLFYMRLKELNRLFMEEKLH